MEGVFSERVYKYKKGNKTIVIKRKWNCKGNSDKNKALNDYLEQNRDIIPKIIILKMKIIKFLILQY